MNDVSTIVIPKENAIEKLAEYRNIQKSARREEDVDFRRLYRMAEKGYPIIDLVGAFKSTGLNEKNQPRLAMARADWETCFFWRWEMRYCMSARYRTNSFRIPDGVWGKELNYNNLSSPVPHIPPKIRPKDEISGYWILFEVQDWTEYPADPYLLKKITGYLYAVVGEWDLTDLERALLGNR